MNPRFVLAALALSLGAMAVTAGAAHDANGASACSNVITGTPADDALTGTPGSDRILGLAGRDQLSGEGSADCIKGGLGGDSIGGGAGADHLEGGEDGDTLSGGEGADVVEGQAGSDELSGGEGEDTLLAGVGADSVREVGDGYHADETINVGSNRIDSGPGRDVVNSANGSRDRVDCGTGTDRALVDREDRVEGCEKKTFLVPPLPEVSPAMGSRRRSFLISFRSLTTTNQRIEFFSIEINGPGKCRKIVSNSVGVTYHRDKLVRYQLRPFAGNGNPAKRWCRGRYRGNASFVETVKAGCKTKQDREPDPACTDERRIGEFSFRVR